MMETLVVLLVVLVVCGLVCYCVNLLPLPAPFKNLALVVVILISILFILGGVGFIGPGFHPYEGRRW
jgi:hypothetical protein